MRGTNHIIKIMRHLQQQYELINKIGIGTFSSVYKANRKSDGLTVAIKIIEAQSEEDVKSITTESNILIHLKGSHPSIPKLYDLFNDGPLYFLIIEYLDGYITLLDWASKFSTIIFNSNFSDENFQEIAKERERTISFIFGQIISSVSYLYQKSVIHRDLKLENIMINPKTNEIKIVDFGLSIISRSMTWSNICGSLEYMAPEIIKDIVKDQNENLSQLNSKAVYSTKSEIWSLGIILYGMTFCKLPFAHPNKQELINLIRLSNISYEPRHVISSKNLIGLLKSMLNKDVNERINFSDVYNHPFLKEIHSQPSKKLHIKSYSCKEDIDKIMVDSKLEFLSDDNIRQRKLHENHKSLPLSFKMNKNHKNIRNWRNIKTRPVKAKIVAPKLIKNS